jgi:hypothetical protein
MAVNPWRSRLYERAKCDGPYFSPVFMGPGIGIYRAATIAGKALALGLGMVMIGALSCGAPTAPAG